MHNLLGIPPWLRRASARLLLLALSVTALGPVAHDMHDDECEPAFVLHDEAQHHVQAHVPAQDGLPDGHCVACHFARSSRGQASWIPTGLAALDRGVLLYHFDGQLRAAPCAAPLPARAPPALA